MKSNISTAAAAAAVGLLCAAGTAQAADLAWVPNMDAKSRQNVVIGGKEPGRDLPICRAPYQKGIHPGKIVAGKCNFGWGGKEIVADRFEVLTGGPGTGWVATRTGAPQPLNAFIGGQEPGRLLPVCRAPYQKGIHPGKVVAGKCNIGWGGREIVLTSYEVMTIAASAPTGPGIGIAGAEVVPTGKQPAGGDLEALLAAYQANLSKEQAVKFQAALQKMQERNANLVALNDIARAIAEAKKKGLSPAKADPRIAKYFASIGLKYGSNWEANETVLKKQADALNKDSQLDMTRLQDAIDKRNQIFQMMTDIIKKMNDSRTNIINSMR